MLTIVPVMANVIKETTTEETIIDATWCISYVSDAGDDTIPYIL